MSYYSPGDDVIYTPKGCGAKIIRALPGDEYIVEFDDKNLIPPQMQIPGQYLRPKPLPYGMFAMEPGEGWSNQFIDRDKQCPRCGTPWKESYGFRQAYYDCVKCNIRKEDA